MKWPSYQDFIKATKTVHQSHLSTMELLTTDDEFQLLIGQARKLAGIPKKGYKSSDEYLKEIEGIHYVLPYLKLKKEKKLNQFNGIIKKIISDWNLPENFDFHIKAYIYLNDITAPVINFSIQNTFNLKTGEISFPQVYRYRDLSKFEVQYSNEWIKETIENNYHPLLTIKQREKPQQSKYLRVERKSKNKTKQSITDTDIAYTVYKDEEKSGLVKKARNVLKSRREVFHKEKVK